MRADPRLGAIALNAALAVLVAARLGGTSQGMLLAASLAALAVTEGAVALRTRPRAIPPRERALALAVASALLAGALHLARGGPLLLVEHPALLGVAAAAVAAGVLLRVAALLALGPWFAPAVAIVEGQELVRHGPYRLARHPGYVGQWLAVVGCVAASGSLPALAAAALATSFHVRLRVRDEEAALALAFGDDWHAYAASTGRYVAWRGLARAIADLAAPAPARDDAGPR